MTNRERYRPFTNDASVRVRFDAAPLEFVLCQIRWPRLSALQGDIRPIAEQFGALLSDLPLYSETQEMSIEVTPAGIKQSPAGTVYQWNSADRATGVSLTRDFVALTSKNYVGYDAFSGQLRDVLTALSSAVEIPLVERIGVRYLNRITDADHLARIDQLVSPELLGHQALTPATADVQIVQALTQSLFQVGSGYLQARSGVLAAGESIDPTVDPIGTQSWVLDIDSFHQQEMVFGVESVLTEAGRLSDAAYDFFKLVIRQGFIEAFEGRQV